ncbi:MAG: GDP-mannose 4,6-dehydratase [Candidatus Omnitrophica bacterium]|nr:GDP-mannose 4,6-dehydratase [Candidatus Omnitrophota bacterium]
MQKRLLLLKNKSILVTGGAGFIGSHLVDELIKERPSKLIVIDYIFKGQANPDNLKEAKRVFPSLTLYTDDLTDYKKVKAILRKEKVDVVFDLATIPLPASLIKPYWTCDTMLKIILNLCELCREGLFKTLIHLSSSEACGSAQYIPMNETHPLMVRTPYAACKASGDLLVRSYFCTFGLDTAIARPYNNYGPRQPIGPYAAIIPRVIHKIMNNQRPIIFGDGRQTRDYIYVTDTVKGVIAAYKNQTTRGKIINIARGEEISMNNLVRIISEIMEFKQKPIYKKSRVADVRRHFADTRLARQLLGFKAEVDIRQGLEETITWYMKKLK